MSKISIKTDFTDGEKLFAQDLNNNFLVIQAGINANEENLQEVIDQAIIELDKQLEEITADRGWDWNGGDRVTFYKGTTQQVEAQPIKNGQLLYNTTSGETALDDEGKRIITGSGNVISISEEEPINPSTKEWIKPITINGEETAEEYFKNNNNEWKKILSQPVGDTLPIGSIAQFGGKTAPTNWLFCNGQAVSRTDYKELFSVIGTTYGEGDGSTTFNVPDFIGRVPVGLDEEDTDFDTLGETGGEKEHTLAKNELPNGVIVNAAGTIHVTTSGNNTIQTLNTGNQPHNNIQPYTVTNFIIKAKQSVGLVGNVVSDMNAQGDNDVANAKTVKDYAKKRVATASLTSTIIGMGQGNINLNNILSNTDNLILSNGGIKIGAGISKILVSGEVFGNAKSSNTSYLWIYIKKNNEIVSNALSNPSSWYTSTALAPKLIEVSEGDILRLYKEDDVTTDIRGGTYTWLTVEVVE